MKNMSIGFLVFACVLAFSLHPALAGEAKIEVRGLRVSGEGFGKDQMMRPFNYPKGTTVILLVTLPGGDIIEMDRKASKLDKLVDDKGNNLLKGTFNEGFGWRANVSKDGKACMLEIKGEGVPAKGAIAVEASGTLLFKCASKKETFKQENVEIKPGTKIAAGKIPFEITKAGKPSRGKSPLQITLKTNQDCSAIAKIQFMDSAGKEIEASPAGSRRMGILGNVTINKSYNLKQKVEKLTIAITYWMDMKEVKVPFTVKTTVGL